MELTKRKVVAGALAVAVLAVGGIAFIAMNQHGAAKPEAAMAGGQGGGGPGGGGRDRAVRGSAADAAAPPPRSALLKPFPNPLRPASRPLARWSRANASS